MKNIKQLDEVDKRILHLIKQRYTYKEISQLVFKSVPAIDYRVRAMKDFYNCETIKELITHIENEVL